MHIHFVGIGGTAMGSVAVACALQGHTVTGSDGPVYEPMRSVLAKAGIERYEEFSSARLIELQPDITVIGNAISRGNEELEFVLQERWPFTSMAELVGRLFIDRNTSIVCAGTHGKTTTSSITAWLLEHAGFQPGYLIGGVPQNFEYGCRPLSPELHNSHTGVFVSEGDEYDTAFFDKRSKFVHYRSRTAILNNLEYDHADIFPDLAAIETQFHHLVRSMPSSARLIVNGGEASLRRVIERGCWSEVEWFNAEQGWQMIEHGEDRFDILHQGERVGALRWTLTGTHNRWNAIAAIAAARHVGVQPSQAIVSLASFENVKRRMETRGIVNGITVIDDFAHHPTAIATTVGGLRHKLGKARILAVLEPRSNTMKLGTMKDALPGSLAEADLVFGYGAKGEGKDALGWDLGAALSPMGQRARAFDDLSALVSAVVDAAQPGDTVLVMSNGGFGGVHQKLLDALGAVN